MVISDDQALEAPQTTSSSADAATPSLMAISATEASQPKRHCWVCFGNEDDDPMEGKWICPCQCRGTMKWCHEDCLQRWIDEKQKRANSSKVTCSQCKTHYVITFPPVNRLVRLIGQFDRVLSGSSPFIIVSAVVGSIYWCCGSYGFISVIQMMGYDEGRKLIDEADPCLLVIGLPVIPVALILAKLIKWEEFVLKLWRDHAAKIPRPLSYIIDKPPARPRPNCDQLLADPGFTDPLSCTRMICGALLLPTMSALVGELLFSRLDCSRLNRSILGGLTFLLFKGMLKIYLRKSMFIRYSQRTIKNYNPATKQSSKVNSSSGELNGASNHDQSTSSATNARGSNPSSSIGEAQTGQDESGSEQYEPQSSGDESDSEQQQPRHHTYFSMTIRLS